MRALIRGFLVVIVAAAFVGTAAAQDVPRPLGVPLGATVAEAERILGRSLDRTGVNSYSRGPMFKTAGAGLGIEGLKSASLVFDASSRLTAVELTMDAGGIGKPAYNRVLGHLQKQYKLVSNVAPPVGDKVAVLETADARIELHAPHLSFEVTVFYLTKDFHAAIIAGTKRDAETRSKNEAGRF